MNPAGQGRRTRRGTASTSGEGEQALLQSRAEGRRLAQRDPERGSAHGRTARPPLDKRPPPLRQWTRPGRGGPARFGPHHVLSRGGLDSPRSWRRGRGRQWEAPKRWTRPDPSPSPGRSCRAGGRGRSSAASPWPGLGPLLLGLRSPPAPPSASEALRA